MAAKQKPRAGRYTLSSLSPAVAALIVAAGMAACQPQALALVEDVTLDQQADLVAFVVDTGEPGGRDNSGAPMRSGDLYVFDPVSETTTQLTRGNRVKWDPWSPGVRWSPDGDFLAIEALWGGSGSEELYLLDVRTGDLTNLTDGIAEFDAKIGAEIAHPVWSPAEGILAFGLVPPSRTNVPREGTTGLYLADAGSGEITQIDLAGSGAEEGGLGSIVWSPDGQQLAFTGANGIYLASIQTGEVRHLASGREPAWSPDGTEIAYVVSASGGGSQIYRISAAGGEPRPVVEQPGSYSTPLWSPDGQYLAFIQSIYDELGGVDDQKLYVTDFDETWLVTDEIDTVRWPMPPVWSPDSATLVSAGEPQNGWICWASVEGGEPDCSVQGVYPVVSPDFQWLAYTTTNSTITPNSLCVRLPEGGESCTETFDGSLFPLGWRP